MDFTPLYPLGVRSASVNVTENGPEITLWAPGITDPVTVDKIVDAATKTANNKYNGTSFDPGDNGFSMKVVLATNARFTMKIAPR
jgi:hypothetical protein